MEQWRSIDFFPNYEVSDMGRIRNRRTDRVLKQSVNPAGFYFVSLREGGKTHVRAVHKMVADAFLDLPTVGSIPVHVNGDRSNNTPGNLKWRNRRFVMRMGNQKRRTGPTDLRRVQVLETGKVFPNALAAANNYGGLEDDVVWAAQDPETRSVYGHSFKFLY